MKIAQLVERRMLVEDVAAMAVTRKKLHLMLLKLFSSRSHNARHCPHILPTLFHESDGDSIRLQTIIALNQTAGVN